MFDLPEKQLTTFLDYCGNIYKHFSVGFTSIKNFELAYFMPKKILVLEIIKKMIQKC